MKNLLNHIEKLMIGCLVHNESYYNIPEKFLIYGRAIRYTENSSTWIKSRTHNIQLLNTSLWVENGNSKEWTYEFSSIEKAEEWWNKVIKTNLRYSKEPLEEYLKEKTELEKLKFKYFQEVGYSYCYMNIWHKDIFDTIDVGKSQKLRVEELVNHFAKNVELNRDSVSWYREQLQKLLDEIENMA